MKTIVNALLTGLMIIASTAAYAGDASESKVLGFSNDGRYFAYMQSGIQDGSGFFYAQIDVIDVEQNKLLKTVYGDSEDESTDYEMLSPAQEQQFVAKLKQTANLNRYGINEKNVGKVVLSRPYTDVSEYKNTVFAIDYWAQGGTSSSIETFKLNITEETAPNEAHNEWCREPFWGSDNSKMMTLSIITNYSIYPEENTNSEEIILQKDTRAPASRSCAWGYRVAELSATKIQS